MNVGFGLARIRFRSWYEGTPRRHPCASRATLGSMSASIAAYADSVEPTALAALTKGGLAAVTKSLAVEYASRGIRVNAVAPGITQTPLLPPESYTPEALAGKLPPLGRVGQVSDIVNGVLYLESAPYVTGEILYIDGGRTA